MKLDMMLLSPLSKVFADQRPSGALGEKGIQGFLNETQSFQIALHTSEPRGAVIRIQLDSPLKEAITVRRVRLVPVEIAAFMDADDNYLRKTPGMYPDLLVPAGEEIPLYPGQWMSLWVDVEPEGRMEAGRYPIKITAADLQGEILDRQTLEVEILNARLPKQKLIHTKWFHTDCLANYYQEEAFSERHWQIIEAFIQTAVKRGINMILTPIHTPPLDTQVGGERLTTQLVDVFVNGGKYSFGFDKLIRWIEICKRAGVEYYEMAHLFTQWGALYTPKIMATVDGTYKRIFGWDVSATSDEYKAFVAEYLPALREVLRREGIEQNTYFHISDEPSGEHIEAYKAARKVVEPYLKGCVIMDALSEYAFYESGAVTKPVPANNAIEPFLEHKVPGLWTYYCIGQYKDVSNLFMAMPSARVRIFAEQLYKYHIEGILQWGYNFYNSQYSRYAVNPFEHTDADGFTPSGDAFQVYPGPDGKPLESIRLMVILHMLQDLRAFEMLEGLTSYEYVMGLMEDGLDQPITFSRYPRSDGYILNLRERVNREIMSRMG